MTLEELIQEGNDVLKTAQSGPIGSFVNESLYEPWKRKALMFVQENFLSHPQAKTFEEIVGHNNRPHFCRQLISILQAFAEVRPNQVRMDYDGLLTKIFVRFHIIARQLLRRYSNRPTLAISDEYDVQDLLHALMKEHFDDIRPEEWTPSYAGGCNRMDFAIENPELKAAREKPGNARRFTKKSAAITTTDTIIVVDFCFRTLEKADIRERYPIPER